MRTKKTQKNPKKQVTYDKEAVNWPYSNQFVFFSVHGALGYGVVRRGAAFSVHSKKSTMNAGTSLLREKILKTYREWHI